MKYLPISLQFFDTLIENNCIYVDKTAHIYHLINQGGKPSFYFFARPRRFGKSLLVSTLEQLFLGKKELFKGLWIEDKIEWNKHPVIKLNFNSINTLDGDLNLGLAKELESIAKRYGVQLKEQHTKDKFVELIEKLSKGKKFHVKEESLNKL